MLKEINPTVYFGPLSLCIVTSFHDICYIFLSNCNFQYSYFFSFTT